MEKWYESDLYRNTNYLNLCLEKGDNPGEIPTFQNGEKLFLADLFILFVFFCMSFLFHLYLR